MWVVAVWCDVSEGEGNSNVVKCVVLLCCGRYLVFVIMLCGLFHNDDAAIGKGGVKLFVVAFMLEFEFSGSAYGEGSDGFVMLW